MSKKAPPKDIKDGKTTRQLIEEYLKREAKIDQEMADLREDKKVLRESYKDRIDLKLLAKAQRVKKAREAVAEKEEEMFQEMLDLLDADLQLREDLRKSA